MALTTTEYKYIQLDERNVDHKEEIDADMERRYQLTEQLRREAGESPLARKLREKGYLK